MGNLKSLGLAMALAATSVSCGRAGGRETGEMEAVEPTPFSEPIHAPSEDIPNPCQSEVERVRERLKDGAGITAEEEDKLRPCLKQEGVELI